MTPEEIDKQIEQAKARERYERPVGMDRYADYEEMDEYSMMSDLHTGYADDASDELVKKIEEELAERRHEQALRVYRDLMARLESRYA